MDRQMRPLSAKLIANKENAGIISLKESKDMKTIPQCLNKVCPPLKANQNKDKLGLEVGKAATRPFMTKSPITGRPIKSAKRKGLSTLQPSASNKSVVVGTARNKGVPHRESKQNKFEIFCEETVSKAESVTKPKVVSSCASTQTDFDEWLSLEEIKKPDNLAEEALNLLRSEPSKEEYYKDIAEQRRKALEETLQENEELYDELEKMKKKCEDMEKALNEAESYKLLYVAMKEQIETNKFD